MTYLIPSESMKATACNHGCLYCCYSSGAVSIDTIRYQLDILLENSQLLQKLQREVNSNDATPLLLAATYGVTGVYDRLLEVADLDVIQQVTDSGELLPQA